MKLSRKSIYALRVLPHLAREYGGRPMSVAQLAELEDLPVKFLEQILTSLRKSGLLVSERGKAGGYLLRRKPEEITLGGIIRALDGPLAPIPCASRSAPHEDPDCPYPFDDCWLRKLMLRVRDNISEVLDQESLADMAADVEDARRKGRAGRA
jgi:Rrf2 family protein